MYTLGTAAKATGVAKSTIYRAIKAGRISASKTDTGDWSIDASELHRVFRPATAEAGAVERDATPDTVRLEAEIMGLRDMANLLRAQLDDVRKDRDAWREQAQTAQRLLTDANPRRGLFSKLFARG
jgi:excisionase family DNA binding protein